MMEEIDKLMEDIGSENVIDPENMEIPVEMLDEPRVLGACPNCGNDILTGKFGPYCKAKCGMFIRKAYGKELSDFEVKEILDNKKILLRGIKAKSGKLFNAYIQPNGIEDYSYDKDGATCYGKRYVFEMTFPKDNEEKEGGES